MLTVNLNSINLFIKIDLPIKTILGEKTIYKHLDKQIIANYIQ